MSFAVVVSDIAPLYTKPEPLCELADEALYGMVVEVLAREGMYCRVRTHYRYEGWTPARCLLEDGAPAAQWQSVPKLVVQKPYIDVLNEPKVQGGCLQSMPRGAFLCPEGGPDENQWQPVRLADGRLGYTKATYLAQPAPAWESVGEDELRAALMRRRTVVSGRTIPLGRSNAVGHRLQRPCLHGLSARRCDYLQGCCHQAGVCAA